MVYGFYPRYVTVGEKKAKAKKKLEQMKKKNPDIHPVLLEGRTIARTWWAKSWNYNLERYADYSNRIGRGRTYVRHGAVLDLRIDAGRVESLVQGSRSKPYSVNIKIKPLNKKTPGTFRPPVKVNWIPCRRFWPANSRKPFGKSLWPGIGDFSPLQKRLNSVAVALIGLTCANTWPRPFTA